MTSTDPFWRSWKDWVTQAPSPNPDFLLDDFYASTRLWISSSPTQPCVTLLGRNDIRADISDFIRSFESCYSPQDSLQEGGLAIGASGTITVIATDPTLIISGALLSVGLAAWIVKQAADIRRAKSMIRTLRDELLDRSRQNLL